MGTCIVTWLGKAENDAAAQKALKARSGANSAAVRGEYKAGTCASVGTDGNIVQAAGLHCEPAWSPLTDAVRGVIYHCSVLLTDDTVGCFRCRLMDMRCSL